MFSESGSGVKYPRTRTRLSGNSENVVSLVKWTIGRARPLTLEGASGRRRGPLAFESTRYRDKLYNAPELENVAPLLARLFAENSGVTARVTVKDEMDRLAAYTLAQHSMILQFIQYGTVTPSVHTAIAVNITLLVN